MKKLCASLVLAFCASFLNGQKIYTIAGNGGTGFSGDGGQATAAEFNLPRGVAIDGLGNLYVADLENDRVRKVSTTGIITTIAGNGTFGYSGDGGAATAAEIKYPEGIAADDSGNVYIADYENNRIRKVNTAGIISTIAGNGTGGFSGDGGAATAAELGAPDGVTVDSLGNIYIADEANNRIRKVSTTGIISTIAGNGTGSYSGDGGAATAAEINYPTGVVVDHSGNVYIADINNNRVRIVSTTGIITTFAGNGTGSYSGDGGQATAAELDLPYGLAMDVSGNLYIGDASNNRIRKVNTLGIISTIAGNGSSGYSGDGGMATSESLTNPNGVAVDASGNVYIADYDNNRIREVTKGSPLALNELTPERENVKIFPNPNNGLFIIQSNTITSNSMVEIYNMLGEKIYNAKLNPTITQIDLSNNADEIYLYRVLTETGDLVSEGKLVIQK
jgi:sugar lactone lactonase YvrE